LATLLLTLSQCSQSVSMLSDGFSPDSPKPDSPKT